VSVDAVATVVRPDGGRLAYRDSGPVGSPIGGGPIGGGPAGGATPVLCLPGLTRNGRDFDALRDYLAPRRRVIRPDMRGRGLSDPGAPDSYTVAVETGDILALLNALEIDRVVVIGTSRGGLQTMALAAARPGLLRAAALNDVGPDIALDGLDRIVAALRAAPESHDSWEAAARAMRGALGAVYPRRGDWDRIARQMMIECGGRPTRACDPALIAATAEAAAAMRAEGPPDLWPLFGALGPVPTLAIRGALSDLLTAETLAAMAARHPDLRTVAVPDVGHAPMLDEPECLAGIDALLAREAQASHDRAKANGAD
jgi:pimeloyl-ACP methyl ester carboxylesterase